MLLSEDGSGATFVTLSARQRDVVGMYLDARRAMTPVHARVLRAEPNLVRGADAVLFIGDAADGRVRGVIAASQNGVPFAVVPGYRDANEFGLAALRIDLEPRVDVPASWSPYLAAVDSPIVAASASETGALLVRSRPRGAELHSPLVLELGSLDESGIFNPVAYSVRVAPSATWPFSRHRVPLCMSRTPMQQVPGWISAFSNDALPSPLEKHPSPRSSSNRLAQCPSERVGG